MKYFLGNFYRHLAIFFLVTLNWNSNPCSPYKNLNIIFNLTALFLLDWWDADQHISKLFWPSKEKFCRRNSPHRQKTKELRQRRRQREQPIGAKNGRSLKLQKQFQISGNIYSCTGHRFNQRAGLCGDLGYVTNRIRWLRSCGATPQPKQLDGVIIPPGADSRFPVPQFFCRNDFGKLFQNLNFTNNKFAIPTDVISMKIILKTVDTGLTLKSYWP